MLEDRRNYLESEDLGKSEKQEENEGNEEYGKKHAKEPVTSEVKRLIPHP